MGGELARFGINSTVGMAGLFDPADKWLGTKEHDNDFGKTITAWGMSGGWFVVMPVAGPVNVRNALGHFVDGAMNPMNYFVPGSAEIYTTMAHSIEGLNERAESLDKFEGVPLHSDKLYPVTLDSPDLYEAVRANFLRTEREGGRKREWHRSGHCRRRGRRRGRRRRESSGRGRRRSRRGLSGQGRRVEVSRKPFVLEKSYGRPAKGRGEINHLYGARGAYLRHERRSVCTHHSPLRRYSREVERGGGARPVEEPLISTG
jgi:MlaA lipoprotein